MALEDFLNRTAAVERKTVARTALRDERVSWNPVAGKEALPCLLRPLRPEQLSKQNRDTTKKWIRVYFAADPGLDHEDRLVVDGRHLYVQGSINVNELDRLYEVDCIERIEP